MKSLAELKQYYESDLLPVLQGFEARRKGILHKSLLLFAVLAGLATALCLLVPQIRQAPPAIIGIGVGALVLFGIGLYFVGRGYAREFKLAVIRRVVEFLDPELKYSPDRCVTEGEFRASRIFEQRIDRYRGEDCVEGLLEKTRLKFSEVHAEYKTETRGSKGQRQTHWHTIFKGLFFVADFNKEFKGFTVVVPDVAERMLGKWLGQMLQSINVARSGELIKLENPEFEKLFAVYGGDQVEARYILSTSLMERIVGFSKKTGQRVCLSFTRSNVNVALPSARDLFEPRLFRTLLDFKMIEQYYEDLALAVGIVEDLNLNTRIWTKQ